MSIPDGDYLFIYYGFDAELAPYITLLRPGADHFEYLTPRGATLTLSFNTDTTYCTGWHNLTTSESSPCPESAAVPSGYSQCVHCQRKTGFNPAFYHAQNVSLQQQARNAQPHFLYLAHFGPGVIKAGISWGQRGIRRLLDQGARSCLIIKDYPSANVARQYEAKAAGLPGIAETLQRKTKYKLLTIPYDSQAGVTELLNTRQRLRDELGIIPDDNQPRLLEKLYMGDYSFVPQQLIQLHDGVISGKTIGMIGGAYITVQADTPYFLSLNSLAGCMVHIGNHEQPNRHTPQQASLL